jgi:hypothetical protein
MFIVEATGASLELISPSMAIMAVALIGAILAKVFLPKDARSIDDESFWEKNRSPLKGKLNEWNHEMTETISLHRLPGGSTHSRNELEVSFLRFG